MEYHVIQDDTTINDDGTINTWDDFATTHAALASTELMFGDFFDAVLAKFLLANDVPNANKDPYMAILAFQGDPRNVGLVNDDKNRFESMTVDSGKYLTLKCVFYTSNFIG